MASAPLEEIDVARALGVTTDGLRKLVSSGVFPDGFELGGGGKGWLPKDVKAYLHLRSRGCKPVTPAAAASLMGCSGEIVQTLRSAGRRLTAEELHSAMAQRGFNFSDGKVKSTAATLVELGQIDNDQDANPRGYGLPEWPK